MCVLYVLFDQNNGNAWESFPVEDDRNSFYKNTDLTVPLSCSFSSRLVPGCCYKMIGDIYFRYDPFIEK